MRTYSITTAETIARRVTWEVEANNEEEAREKFETKRSSCRLASKRDVQVLEMEVINTSCDCDNAFRLTPEEAHPEWYWDGVEDGVQCWRLDLDNDIQVQLFAHEVLIDHDLWAADKLFIEQDVREQRGSESVRVRYACDSWPISNQEAHDLLEWDGPAVATILADKLAHVRQLPDQVQLGLI